MIKSNIFSETKSTRMMLKIETNFELYHFRAMNDEKEQKTNRDEGRRR